MAFMLLAMVKVLEDLRRDYADKKSVKILTHFFCPEPENSAVQAGLVTRMLVGMSRRNRRRNEEERPLLSALHSVASRIRSSSLG